MKIYLQNLLSFLDYLNKEIKKYVFNKYDMYIFIEVHNYSTFQLFKFVILGVILLLPDSAHCL